METKTETPADNGSKHTHKHDHGLGLLSLMAKIIAMGPPPGFDIELCPDAENCTDPRHKQAHDEERAHIRARELERDKKTGKHFAGYAVCSGCRNAAVKCVTAIMTIPAPQDEEKDTGLRPLCRTCLEIVSTVLGGFLMKKFAAPCGLCVSIPVPDGQDPNTWIVLCDGHKTQAEILKNI